MKRIFCGALMAGAMFASAQVTTEERKGLSDALYLGNLTVEDLKFARREFNSPRLLAPVRQGLDDPLSALDALMGLHMAAARTGAPRALAQAQTLLGDPSATIPISPAVAELPKELPSEFHGPVLRLFAAVNAANQAVREAQKNLKPAEIRQLIEGLPRWAVEEPKVEFEFVKGPTLSGPELLKLVDRLDLPKLRAGAQTLLETVERERAELGRLAALTKWEGLVRFKIGDAPVVVAGVGDDTHRDRDVRFLLDLGGNDRYYGRGGAGPGYAALQIDLSGDDHYKVPDVGLGCGLVGIGVAYDLGGYDHFKSGSLALGAGLAGVGVLVKAGGDDIYDSGTLAQGFGQFGVGLLLDSRGRDVYRASLFAQGAARTQGVGWLIDQGGDDTYRCGGLVLNSPLFSDVHYSFGQGFGSGYREDTGGEPGGIGLLSDGGGDDAYLAETYAQAASYWYSLGSLGDLSGKDSYRSYHYSQASAMHATSAYLLDLDGDDTYAVGFGAAHAIGHDYGVAVLFDRAGEDIYAARDSRPGIGNANGLGLFIEVAGDDRYAGPPGVANPGRGSGSLGVFADLGGADQYRDGLADEEGAVRPEWAIAYDAESKKVDAGAVAEDVPPTPNPGSLSRPADNELERIYGKATQWGVGTAQNETREAVNQLISIGLPALEWMVQRKLPKADRLQLRAFYAVVRAVGAPAKTLIASRIESTDPEEAKLALRISSETQAIEAGPQVAKALARPELVREAARAAGPTQSRESIPLLAGLLTGPEALPALLSLRQLGDATQSGPVQQLLNSPSVALRKGAVAYLAKTPDSLIIARALIGEGDERRARLGIELLGAMGSPEALDLIGPLLPDPRPGVRISALLALDGRAPAAFRQAVLDRRRDPDARVRGVAMRIDPGR